MAIPSFWPSSWRRLPYLRSPSSASVQQPHCPRHHPRSAPINVEPVNVPKPSEGMAAKRRGLDTTTYSQTTYQTSEIRNFTQLEKYVHIPKKKWIFKYHWKQWQMMTYTFLFLEDAASVQHVIIDHASRWDFWKRCCVSNSPAWHHSWRYDFYRWRMNTHSSILYMNEHIYIILIYTGYIVQKAVLTSTDPQTTTLRYLLIIRSSFMTPPGTEQTQGTPSLGRSVTTFLFQIFDPRHHCCTIALPIHHLSGGKWLRFQGWKFNTPKFNSKSPWKVTETQ